MGRIGDTELQAQEVGDLSCVEGTPHNKLNLLQSNSMLCILILHTIYRPVARIFARRVTWVTDVYACITM